MKLFSYFLLTTLVSAQSVFAVETNARLAATMGNVSKDIGVVQAPTKAEPEEVKEVDLLNGIVRSRTATFLLQLCDSKKGSVVEGVFKSDELTPPGFAKLSVGQVTVALERYSGLLQKAQQKIAVAEAAVATEFAKKKEDRDYTDLKRAVDDVLSTMKEGHIAFKPPKP